MKKAFFIFLLCWGLIFSTMGSAQESQVEKAKIFQDEYPLISDTDMYCSIAILEGEGSDIKIVGAEKQEEKMLFRDADTLFINKGSADGIEIGQLFLAVSRGPQIKGFGHLITSAGRVRVVRVEEKRSVAQVDKACGEIVVGSSLVPHEEKMSVIGKDEGYAQELDESQGLKGSIIYVEGDIQIMGSGYRGLIDLGRESGIQRGQQMTIFKRVKKNLPRAAIGNLVVTDVQKKTSTVKILSCRDSIEIGQQVQTK